MKLSYDEIFKYSDIFNPISLQTLNSAGKLAKLNPGKTLIDLGCGKGHPALFWASAFGVEVEGVDVGKINVDYANARTKMLNLSDRARFFCDDLREFKPTKKYDFVSSLGIESDLYGGRVNAFKLFKSMLNKDGIIVFSEPVWRKKPVSPQILKSLMCTNESFLTMVEMGRLMEGSGLKQLGCFVASREDWKLYVRSPILSLREILREKKEFEADAKVFLEDFETEAEAAGKHWDSALWVLKPQ